MSLIGSLYTTFSGLRAIESQISTVSSNVTNADKAGYTTKTYESDYATAGGVTVPVGGMTVGSLDKALYKATIDDMTDAGYYNTLAEYLDGYATALGGTDSDNSIAAALDEFTAQLSVLAASPEDDSQKILVVDAAQTLASALNDLSSTVQDLRLQASQAIATSVDNINQNLQTIDSLNQQILTLQAQGLSSADLEDERMVALESLAQEIDISYFTDSNNQMKIYTAAGLPLLATEPHFLSYEPAVNVSSSTVYPGGFDAITLNGADITDSLKGGTLAALVTVRDEALPAEQEKLDALAQALADTMNAVLNTGTSYPPRTAMTGDTDGLSAADTFSATGTLRLAVTDEQGKIVGITDIDLSLYATVADLVAVLDAVPGVQATLDSGGSLALRAENDGEALAMNQMNSAVGGDAVNFGTYFGLNNLFAGDGAETIHVSSYLLDNPEYLATAMLSGDAALAVGDSGIYSGDGTVAEELYQAANGDASFVAAGNLTAQTTSFSAYGSKIISYAATAASNAQDKADTAQLLYDQTKESLQNKSGVNLDEETAHMTVLESHYQASALMISTVRDLFDTLINAVR